jgi:alpha-L-rhamnosidase
MRLYKRLSLFLLLYIVACIPSHAIDLIKVTCEMTENPSGVTRQEPRLGWQLFSKQQGDKQTAYQIIVSSAIGTIKKGLGDEWNSEKINSGESQHIVYAGKHLQQGQRYYWRVRVWDANGKTSAWSDVAYWEMAPELSDVQWIGAISHEDSKLPAGREFHAPVLKKKEIAEQWNNVDPLAKRSIMLRKPITIQKKVSKAVVYVSGLGHYELTVNGKKVGSSEFAPLWSDYDKTVYYNTYSLDNLLRPGSNVLGVLLGNGMYNVTGDRYRKLLVSFGPPTLFFRLSIQYTDGTQEIIASDASWKYAESPITFNCIYGGEDYDAQLEQNGWDKPGFDDAHWKPVVLQRAPRGILRPQLAAPVKVMKEYPVKTSSEPQPGVYVLDMGQNLSGYPVIKVSGKKGQQFKLLVGEALTKEGLVNQKRSGAPYYYQYTLKGDGVEEWHPRFSYYGFQYIQVEGADVKTPVGKGEKPVILDIRSTFIYNSSGETGQFECSNDIFNKAHLLINNAVKSNWQSIFTDCPHREKLGWLEETHLNGPGLLYTYDLTQFIPKVMQDIADGQRPDGLVPSIVPEYVIFGGDFTDSPEWGIAAVILPWMYYEYYGDQTLIRQHYAVMKRYVDFLTSKADNHILSHGLGDWYDYGEHAAGYSKNSPIALSATAHYYFAATLVKKAASLLRIEDDAAKYDQLAINIKEAYNTKFFNPQTKQYATASQYSNAVSLFMDMVDPQYKQAVLDNLVADVRNRGNRLTTGDVGNRYLYQALARNGYNDVMFAMHNHHDTPGYGFQISFGLTTLTEQWDPRKGNSWNHFMMGQIDEWFYRTLAGIVPDTEVPGFKHFVIQPEPVGDLTYVKASHRTLYGDIKVQWKRENKMFKLTVTIPVNTTATVVLPGGGGSKVLGSGEYSLEWE